MVPTHSQTWSNLCECWLGGSCSGSINKHCLSSRTSNRAGPPGGTRGEVSPKDVVFNNFPIYIWQALALAIIASVSLFLLFFFNFYNTVFHSTRHTGLIYTAAFRAEAAITGAVVAQTQRILIMAANGVAALRFDLSDSTEAILEFTKQDGSRVKTTSDLTDRPLALDLTHLCTESIYISASHKVLHWLLMSFSCFVNCNKRGAGRGAIIHRPTIIRTLIEQSASYICCYASVSPNMELSQMAWFGLPTYLIFSNFSPSYQKQFIFWVQNAAK